ncbi:MULTISPECIES: NTP transferase domain-containing protein [Wolbachia]|uniref:NTP transferase domain-containing protein n=1 Tax=Wolbachia TaxID=953 RepID=UPI0002403631|nr:MULTISPECIES: NTP transferase domain-containing protein [Wolbachia]QBB84145.1 bifunctional N-acetylglucosamine-1-phosphate uridyltransferase/glucosamine-1-phosphate acetyltransferase [Wolbachia pipientis wAlbB]QDW08944.1 bifunctional N-acetylglucosamine-1-phosphate uridyltransferase/glucosamine-1-phosphate acetyltransferase [Wolbachia pipientis]QDW10139.1 bifunctional N-acetylglucosamine-1-phosphate uridyltransferase/glucosamine-1-phosphate acetyltransferase [Wolbachia pipientis]QZA83213.1 N
MTNKAYTFVVLAAGHGKRMNSSLPKVLHKIGNFSMLEHVIYNAKQLNPEKIVIVVDLPLTQRLKCFEGIKLITQESTLGTGDAVKIAMRNLKELSDIVVVQYGDTPLIKSSTITKMISCLGESNALVCLGFKTNNKGYGRLIIENGSLREIVEAQNGRNNDEEFLANAGIMVAREKNLRELVEKIECNNQAHEYYLTGIVAIAVKSNLNVGYVIADEEEATGINNRNDLATAEFYFQEEKRKFFTNSGVTLVAPETVFFSLDTQIGMDSIIYPYVFFGPGVKIGSGVRVGPFAKCENTTIGDGAIIGNFVETKASDIGINTKIKHLSYIGNTQVGQGSNIGAGTVVCNYDGKKKRKTNIGSNCFIGANSSLIAPLNVHDDSLVAAGSVIVEDVPKGSLAIARERQVTKKIK